MLRASHGIATSKLNKVCVCVCVCVCVAFMLGRHSTLTGPCHLVPLVRVDLQAELISKLLVPPVFRAKLGSFVGESYQRARPRSLEVNDKPVGVVTSTVAAKLADLMLRGGAAAQTLVVAGDDGPQSNVVLSPRNFKLTVPLPFHEVVRCFPTARPPSPLAVASATASPDSHLCWVRGVEQDLGVMTATGSLDTAGAFCVLRAITASASPRCTGTEERRVPVGEVLMAPVVGATQPLSVSIAKQNISPLLVAFRFRISTADAGVCTMFSRKRSFLVVYTYY